MQTDSLKAIPKDSAYPQRRALQSIADRLREHQQEMADGELPHSDELKAAFAEMINHCEFVARNW